MNTLINDVRIAMRQHARQPGFALTVVWTLALTVAATAVVFAVVNTVLLRALPFAAAEQLVWIASVRPDNPSAPFSLPEYMDYRSQTRTLAGMAAYANWSASLAGDGLTERFQGARMSGNAMQVLGVTAAAGRLLNDDDDRADAPLVAMLSHRLWQQRYGGDANIVGTTARINGEPFVIVGVLPAEFPLPLRDIDVVAPLAPDRDPLRHLRNSVNFLRVFGRLHASADVSQARAELTAICLALRGQFPVEYARKERVEVLPLHDVLVADHRRTMLLLFAAVVVVLATALANLVALALVRANGRRRDLTMRIAIGASRLHLVRQLTVEALLLAAVGSLAGWVLAGYVIAAVPLWAPPSIPRLGEVRVDGTVALLILMITAVVTLLLAAAPLGALARTSAADVLRAAGRGSIGDHWNHRVRNVLVVAEISAALVLLLATIALLQNFRALQDLQPGFDPDEVFQARLSIPSSYRTPDDLSRFYDRLLERLAAAPGVRQIGMTSIAPLSGLLATVPFHVEGEARTDRDRSSANIRAISPAYFSTVGTRVLQGRAFAETDRADTPHVAIVSQALANRILSGDAIGRRLLIDDNNEGSRPVEIIGVVENVRQTALDVPAAFDVYIPLRQIHRDSVALVRNNQFWMVKTGSDPAAFRATFGSEVRALDPDVALSDAGTMRDFVAAWFGPRRFNLALFAAFALTAILLAVSGLYGLVAYAVSQRAAEIGLRIAIGATQSDVHRMILGQAALLGIAGSVVGLVIAIAARPAIAGMIQDTAVSPVLVVATAAALIAVVLIAAWLPARRAARIDPTLALRSN